MRKRDKTMKIVVMSLLFMLCFGQLFSAPCADVNSDGNINIVDALLIAQFYVDLNPDNFDPGAADVNGDNMITIVDALDIARYYVNIIDSFPGCDDPVTPEPGTPDPGPISYELQAETEAEWDNAAIESDHAGYTGSGYVNTTNSSGTWIEWSIDVASDTNATCEFRYACSDARSMDLSISGSTVDSLNLSGSGAWTDWAIETADVVLTAGSNTIRLTATSGNGAPNIDKLDITLYDGPIVTSTPTPTPGPATPSPDPSDWENADPREVIKSGNPGNSKLVTYADIEIHNPAIGLAGTGTARTITGSIVVPPGVTYDGKGEILTASGMGSGDQDEEQQPYFILLPGANLKNVTLTSPGVEGVHMMGFNKLENVVWQDVGEDAASVRSYFPGGIILIEGGSANSAADKVFQINSPCKVIVKNFRATNISKLLRQNEDVPMDIVMDGIDASNVKTAIVMANTSDCTLRHRNVSGGSLTNGPVRILPWVDGCSDWDGTMEWGGPGSE